MYNIRGEIMQSMTGYGKAEYSTEKLYLSVELKAVNNRFLDLVPKTPRVFLCFEDLIRKTVASKVARGRVELFVTLIDNREKEKNIDVDISLAKGYVKAYNLIKESVDGISKEDFPILSLMRMPDVVKEGATTVDTEFYKDILVDTLNSALDKFNEMRKIEGEKLKIDILQMVEFIEEAVKKIIDRAPLIKENYRQKLQDRLKEVLSDVKYDETRLLQEVAIFADKSNIDEELTRLNSHISQFREIVKGENAGKKLDFLVQEFNREANTICSKSNDLEITRLGLAIKCEIEKIREQIQNIE